MKVNWELKERKKWENMVKEEKTQNRNRKRKEREKRRKEMRGANDVRIYRGERNKRESDCVCGETGCVLQSLIFNL